MRPLGIKHQQVRLIMPGAQADRRQLRILIRNRFDAQLMHMAMDECLALVFIEHEGRISRADVHFARCFFASLLMAGRTQAFGNPLSERIRALKVEPLQQGKA